MRKLLRWAHTHPLKACVFAALTTFIATFTAFRDDLLFQGIGAFITFTIVAYLIVKFEMRAFRVFLCLCVACLAFEIRATEMPQEQEPPPETAENAGCIIVVIVVAGVMIYSLVKFCQRHFPPPPPPDGNKLAQEPTGSSAATYNKSTCGSCATTKSLGGRPHWPTTFHITGRSDVEGITIEEARLTPHQNVLSWESYEKAIEEHGVKILSYGSGEKFYGRGGLPADPSDVPITFNEDDTVTVSNGSPTSTVVVERSEDLLVWTQLAVVHVAQGYKFKFVDTSVGGQAFYRVSR